MGLTVAMKARGTTAASGCATTSMRRIRLTISPSRISEVVCSRFLSSSVTPSGLRTSTARLPSASLSRYVFVSTSATAVAQVVW